MSLIFGVILLVSVAICALYRVVSEILGGSFEEINEEGVLVCTED